MNMIATRKFSIGLFVLALCAIVIGAATAQADVRISQVYGGGGASSAGPPYNVDYVELFNNSTGAFTVPAPGWSLQYGSSTGTSYGSTSGNMPLIPAGTVIPACGYLLIQCGTVGTSGAALPVTADIGSPGGPNIAATSGKIALMDYQTGSNGCMAVAVSTPGNTVGGNFHIVDAVGWGPTANCYETAPGPVTTNAQAIVRSLGGGQDTNNNAADFSIDTAPVPRNSASPDNALCSATTQTPAGTWGRLKTIYR